MEVWKSIDGFEGLYEVSNRGRVKSSDHYVKNGRGDRIVHGKILTELAINPTHLQCVG